MMEDKIVRQYVRAVSRKLICSKATRSKLLNGLKQELSAYSELSYNELCAKVGNPEQIAEQLLESAERFYGFKNLISLPYIKNMSE